MTVEDQIAKVKSECRQQIIDGEIESYKLRLLQSNTEKDELIKMVKELEKKYRDLQAKSDADEQSWTRMKKDLSDKQRKVTNEKLEFVVEEMSMSHFLVR